MRRQRPGIENILVAEIIEERQRDFIFACWHDTMDVVRGNHSVRLALNFRSAIARR